MISEVYILELLGTGWSALVVVYVPVLLNVIVNLTETETRKRKMSITKKADKMPGIYRKNYLAVVEGKASPRNAIKAFCIECQGYQRKEVTKCNVIDCPLNLFRPYQKENDEDLP